MTRRRVFTRDGFRCVKCGLASRLECHHVVPLDVDRGQDPYDADGCVALCHRHHIEVHRREVSDSEYRWRALVRECL
ncbi:HNH endonuclease [Candidatus Poriferisodalis sp.]|uniref:HNH endonuclease n=1 Tax=Candidatus Poriferisodalis sp. TaxID=3101277 RepID=UPI003B0284DE